MSVFSAIFVLKENGTQSHSARFLNWRDHVNSVPDLAASPPCIERRRANDQTEGVELSVARIKRRAGECYRANRMAEIGRHVLLNS